MQLIKILFLYIASILIATIFFIGAFWTSFLSNDDSLFFRAAGIIALVTVILFALLLFARHLRFWWFNLLSVQDIFLICMVFFIINWQVYGLIPFNVTRSNSIILLDYLYARNGAPVSKSDIENYVSQMYFKNYDSIGVRLNEQIKSGNIAETDDGWVITKKGQETARLMSYITNLYNPQRTYFIHVEPE